MTSRSVIEAELRATVAEAVGSLRLVSETVGPLDGGVALAAKLP